MTAAMTILQSSVVAGAAPPATQSGAAPAYSVIIEWENVLLADSGRAVEMLHRLARQVGELASGGVQGEVILVRDAGDAGIADDLASTLRETFGNASDSIRVIGVDSKRYYEKKNEGAAIARGGILVFLDSDVIPEERWLECMLAAFDDPGVQVAAGSTYIAPTTLYSKAFAAFWFFPPRSDAEGPVPADILFGNNIAFRRELFLAYPYPALGQFRGQAGTLIRELRALGVGIVVQRSSRCAHPPPHGFMHFVRRAMCDGHDNVVIARRSTGRDQLPWRYAYWSARSFLQLAGGRIRQRHAAVGLTPLSWTVSILLAWSYAFCMTLGDILTRLDPTAVARRFSI